METRYDITGKICSGCPEKGPQPVENFTYRPLRNSLRSKCKACSREDARKYRESKKGINNISKEEMEYREAGRRRMLELYPDRDF